MTASPARSRARALLAVSLALTSACDARTRVHAPADAAAREDAARAATSREIDLGAILERGRLAFRPSDGGFEGGDRNYRVRVDDVGLAIIAFHGPPGEDVRRSHVLHLGAPSAHVGDLSLEEETRAPERTPEGEVIIERGWATERLANRAGGLEQTWTFREAPRGAGPLVVRIEAPSLSLLTADEAGLHLAPAPGELGLVYGHGTWVEADGSRRPIQARWSDGGIELEVPEEVLAHTRWPAVLDPVIGPEVGPGISTYVTGAQGTQEESDLAVGPGGALAVWTDTRRAGTPEVWASRIGPAGEVLDPVGLFVAGGVPGVADVTVAYGGGVYLIAWARSHRVWARRMTPSGTFLDAAPFEVGGLGPTYQLDAAFDGTDFVVAWADDHDLLAARVTVEGGVRDPSALVLAAAPGTQQEVELAVAAGTVIAVWSDTRAADADVYGARIAGGVVLDPGGVLLVGGADPQLHPVISASGSDLVVAWRDANRLHAALVDPVSLAITPTWTSPRARLHGWPAIGGATGGHVLAWTEYAATDTVTRAMVLGPSGRPTGSPREVRRATEGWVEAMAFDGGAYLCTHGDTVEGSPRGRDVLLLRISSAGTLESSEVLSRARAAQRRGTLAQSGGAYLLAWETERSASDGLALLAMRIAGDGTPIDTIPIELESGGLGARNPTVAGDGEGGWLVAWESVRSTPWGGREIDVRARTVSASGTLGSVFEVERGGSLSRTAAAGGPGGYLLVYLDNAEVLARRVSTTGAVLDASALHPRTRGSGADQVAVAFDGESFLVVWDERRSPGSISGALVSTSGFVTPAGVVASEPDGWISYVGLARGEGSMLLTWTTLSFTTHIYAVRAARVDAAGAPIGGPFDVATRDVILREPTATFEGTDFFVTYWSYLGLDGARFTTGGAPRDPAGVRLLDPGPYDTQLASTGDGRALLAYTRFDESTGSDVVRARLIDFTRPGGEPSGTPCTSSWGCASGHCVDGVCCDAECGEGATTDCQVCAASLGATADGACTVLAAGTECRAVDGACDVAEVCDGWSRDCPVDGFAAPGALCGEPASDACDLDDFCTGGSAECETTARAPAGTVCRTARGACDVEETCDGSDVACPPDRVRASGEVCRAVAGECDVAEACDGISTECPGDGVAAAGIECRPSAGVCDVAEACDGFGAACPSNTMMATGVVCRAAVGECDRDEVCTGTDAACPIDERALPRTICRAAAGPCDEHEVCDGRSGACPADRLRSAGAICRVSAGPCDTDEACDGESTACPPDVQREDGASCDDGLACNGAEMCASGECIEGSAVACERGEACVEPGACLAAAPHPGCGCRAAAPRNGALTLAIVLVALELRRSARRRRNRAGRGPQRFAR